MDLKQKQGLEAYPMVEIFNLDGIANGNGYVFLGLADGHRLGGGDEEVGRGWLEPGSSTDDWLVSLTPVPIPAARHCHY